jgi:transposase
LRSRGNHWTKRSVAAALGFRWDGQKTRLLARTRPDSFDSESLIEFLNDLKRFVKGDKVILIWDHLPAHRSRVMNRFLVEQRHWLSIEWLPSYAPDLNPTEGVWTNIKGRELANFCPDQIEQATNAFRRGLRRVAHTLNLPFSFLQHAGLFF